MRKATTEQLKALRDFAATNGRTWKSVLREAWMTGEYPADSDSQQLQLVRNNLGPSWLVSFRLQAEATEVQS